MPSLTEFRKVSDDKMGYYFNQDYFKNGLNVRVNSSCEHSPRANPDHLMHDESRGPGHLVFNSVPGPREFANKKKNLLRNIMSSIPTALRVKGFKHRHFGIRRAFIDHKRHTKPIKPFALSLFSRSNSFYDLFYAVLLSWNSYVYWKMATNIFVYWSDGLGDQAFDHHSRNEGRGNCQQKLPAGPGICPIFSNAQGLPREDARGWNWLAHKPNVRSL